MHRYSSVHKELDDEKMCKFIDEIKYDLDKLNRLAVNAVQLVDSKEARDVTVRVQS